MQVNDPVLTDAIAHAAILLGRSFWYEPERLNPQRAVWRDVIDGFDGEGELTTRDFQVAVGELIAKHGAREVMPTMFIGRACLIAAQRRAEADLMVRIAADEPAHLLYQAVNSYHEHSQPDEQLKAELGAALHTLAYAGLARDTIAPVVRALQERYDQAIERRRLTRALDQ